MKESINRAIENLRGVSSLARDTREEVDKSTLMLVSLLIGAAGVIWGVLYLSLGLMLAAVFPLAYSLLVGAAFLYYIKTRKLAAFLYTQLFLILWLPFLLQWSVGGFANSGAVMIWAVLAPLGAVMFHGVKQASRWFAAYIVLIVFSILTNGYWEAHSTPPGTLIKLVFYAMNIGAVSLIIFLTFMYFVFQLQRVHEAQQKALERELEIGREIQAGFLPAKLPEPAGWKLSAYFQAARKVGGDFYDVFEIGQRGHVAIVVADVCGKGVGAALFMTLFRSMIRATMKSGDYGGRSILASAADEDDKAILLRSIELTNNYIAHTHGHTGMFASMFLSILDPATHTLRYINAGQESPVLLHGGAVKTQLATTGSAVGVIPDQTFEVAEMSLAQGDTLVLYTDGVTEAHDPADAMFGEERLAEALTGIPLTANEACRHVRERLQEFMADRDQFDDITLLALTRK